MNPLIESLVCGLCLWRSRDNHNPLPVEFMSEKVKSIHNPSYACSCEVKFTGKAYSIEYCPMHKAAPDLLSACQFALKYHEMHVEKGNGKELPHQLATALLTAIIKANTCPQ